MNTERIQLQILTELIKKGSLKHSASTGYPMNRLYGAAKLTATLSNIGGGSIKSGGGGMKRGLEYLVQQAHLKGQLEKSSYAVS